MKGLFLLALTVLATAAFGQSDNQVHLIQISLVPSIPPAMGVYHVSLNLFAGYNNGIQGVELGSFANINSGMVKGVQFSGFTNVTHGPVLGMQGSGFANVSTNSVKGFQTSGFYNHSRDLVGVQTGGFANVAVGMLRGCQASGFANVVTDEMTGAQVASFINYAEDVRGAQVSGFVNRASKLNGVQVGIINIADTVEAGATIGLINIVKKGMMAIEIEYNDVLDINASFKSGTTKLYGIVTVGTKVADQKWWGIGAGLGSQLTVKNSFFAGAEITTHTLLEDLGFVESYMLNRVAVNLGYKPFDKIAVIGGPTLNFLWHDKDATGMDLNSELGKNPLREKETGSKKEKVWIGYRVAIRF